MIVRTWGSPISRILAALLEGRSDVGSVIPGSDHHPGAECAGPAAIKLTSLYLFWVDGGRDRRRDARRWIGILDGNRAQRESSNAWPMSNYPRVVAQSEASLIAGASGGVLRTLSAAESAN